MLWPICPHIRKIGVIAPRSPLGCYLKIARKEETKYDAHPTQAKKVHVLLTPTERYSGEASWYGTLDTVIDHIDSVMTTAEKTTDQATRALFMDAGTFVLILLRTLAAKLGLALNNNQGQAAAIGQGGAHAPVAHERARG